MDAAKLERIKQKNVDMTFVVLLSLFDAIIENRTINDLTFPVIPTQKLYEKLVSLKVRKSPTDLPNLTSFLTYKQSQTDYIDVKRLANATSEFLRSHYLQSFGLVKNKDEDL